MRPSQRRIADTRILGSITRQLDEEPNPRAPRSLAASSSTSTSRTEATGATTSCAIRIPGSTENGVAAGVQEDDADLAAVAGVDEPGRVDDADPVARREPRARLDEPRVALGISTATPVGTTARSPGSSTDGSQAARSSPASPSYAWLGNLGVRPQPANGDVDHRAEASSSCSSSATR